MDISEQKYTTVQIKDSIDGLNSRMEGQRKESVNWKIKQKKII